MKSIIKKLSLYATVGTLGMSSFVGCGHSEDSNQEEVIIEESNMEQEEVMDIKYFDVGEHVFYQSGNIYYSSGNISIPEGYAIIDIDTISSDRDVDEYIVWFQNQVPVEAKAIKEEFGDEYYYGESGTPVLEKSEEVVQKVK